MKSNLFVETRIIHSSKGYPRTENYTVSIFAKVHIYALSREVYHKVSVNGQELPGIFDEDLGIIKARCFNATIGDQVVISVYRVTEYIDNASMVGTLTGTVTDEGLTFESSSKSLTVKAKNEIKKVHKFGN